MRKRLASSPHPDVPRLLATAISDSRRQGASAEELARHRDDLSAHAILHRVSGPLVAAFTAAGVTAPRELVAMQEADAMKRMTVLHDLAYAKELFDREEIPYLVFKGPVLTTLVGRDEWERPSLDLDVLVHAADIERAVDALVSAGSLQIDRNWAMVEKICMGELHLVLPTTTSLDLHWHLLVKESMRSDFGPDHPDLFATARMVDLDGVEVPTFGPAATFVYSCLHGAISGGHRMVWLKDIERLARHDVDDWGDVVALAERWRCSLVVGAMLQRSSSQLGLELPPGLLDQLIPSSMVRRTFSVVDRRHPVTENVNDESFLRLATRSIGPTPLASLRRLASRAAAFARRRTLHHDFEDATELFVDDPGAGARERYFRRLGSLES